MNTTTRTAIAGAIAAMDEPTKTVKIKVIPTKLGALPQHPSAPLGMDSEDVITYAITDIPDDVPMDHIIRLFNVTADCTWIGKGPGQGRHTFKFSELGHGRIISQ